MEITETIGREGTALTRQKTLLRAAAIFFTLGSIYLLTFNGSFRLLDELRIFATAESLVRTGSLDIPQLSFWRTAVRPYEFLQPVLSIPLYWLAQDQAGVGNIHTVMLFNVMVTAATGVALFLISKELGYGDGVGLGVAFLYGLATMAWPYSRTYFREPLVGLLYALAFLSLLIYRRTARLRWGLVCAALIVFSIAAKITSLLAVPVFGVALYLASPKELRKRILWLGGSALFIAGIIFALVVWQRWGPAWFDRLLRPIWQGTTPGEFLLRMWGLTLSPGKGLLVYSPALILGIWGAIELRNRQRFAVAVILGVALFYIFGYSLRQGWYTDQAWGPRYMVPLIPLLAIPAAEIFRQGSWKRGVSIALVTISLAIQFVAATADFDIFLYELRLKFLNTPRPFLWNEVLTNWGNIGLSPIVGQFQIWNPKTLDLIWLRPVHSGESPLLQPGILLAGIALLTLASGFLIYTFRASLRRASLWSLAVVGVGFAIGVSQFLLRANSVPSFYPEVEATCLPTVAREINRNPGRRLLVSVSDFIEYNAILNYLKGDLIHYWFSPTQEEEFEILRPHLAGTERIFLVFDHIPPGPEGEEEALSWLRQNANYLSSKRLLGYRLYEFAPLPAPPSRPEETVPHPTSFNLQNQIELIGYQVQPAAIHPGGTISLTLFWRALNPPPEDYTVFTHLIDEQDRIWGQKDSPPLQGCYPTSRWNPEEIVRDEYLITVDPLTPRSIYRVEVGMYDPQTGERLPLLDEQGRALDNRIILPVEFDL